MPGMELVPQPFLGQTDMALDRLGADNMQAYMEVGKCVGI